MAPKKAEVHSKRGRGRPPKDTALKAAAAAKPVPSRPRGRPSTAPVPETATLPKRRPGRPPKNATAIESEASKPTAKRRGRPPGSTNATRPTGVLKRRGRPPGRTNAAKAPVSPSAQKAPPPTPATKKRGRPRGKHVGNLTSTLAVQINGAPQARLAELLAFLCDRNAAVARATSTALGEEQQPQSEASGAEETERDAVAALEAEGYDKHGDGDVLVFSRRGNKAGNGGRRGKTVVDKIVRIHVEKDIHVTVDKDRHVGVDAGKEPASGYEADVEPEIPATGTEAATTQTISDGNAGAEAETIAQAVSSARDGAFGL